MKYFTVSGTLSDFTYLRLFISTHWSRARYRNLIWGRQSVTLLPRQFARYTATLLKNVNGGVHVFVQLRVVNRYLNRILRRHNEIFTRQGTSAGGGRHVSNGNSSGDGERTGVALENLH